MPLEFIADYHISTRLCAVVGLVYALFYNRLSGIERLILVCVALNILADYIAGLVADSSMTNGFVYNIFAPIVKIVTLIVYALHCKLKRGKQFNFLGIAIIIIMSLIGTSFYKDPREFHNITYLISGFVVAILSYIHLRTIIKDQAGNSFLVFIFALANLVYYTLMVSSISATPLASSISPEFGLKIYTGNLIGYILWSVILLIGIILWKKPKKT